MKQKHTPEKPEAAVRRKHRWYFYPGILLLAVAVLAGCFVGFLTATEYRPEAVEPALAGPQTAAAGAADQTLRILTFNTGYAGLGEESDFVMDGGKGAGAEDPETVEKNMEGIRQILQAADADLYMLQEIDRRSQRTFDCDQLNDYAEILPGFEWHYAPNYVCRYVPYPLQSPMGRIDSGLATYSRYPVREARRISLPVPFSWPLRIANLKRCMLETRIPLEDSEAELVLINFHLEAYDDGAGKTAQTRQLMELMRSEFEKGNYVIAGGDFNQIFPGVETVVKPTSQWVPGNLDPLPQEMEGWRYVFDDTEPTCRLLNQPYDPEDPLTQYYVIDGFILSPNVELIGIETHNEHFRFSDHNPVLLEVALTAPAA